MRLRNKRFERRNMRLRFKRSKKRKWKGGRRERSRRVRGCGFRLRMESCGFGLKRSDCIGFWKGVNNFWKDIDFWKGVDFWKNIDFWKNLWSGEKNRSGRSVVVSMSASPLVL